MKLINKPWLSWTIRAVLYLPLIALVVSFISAQAQNRRFARISRSEVEHRYRELVGEGKLEAPAKGLDAVTFTSQHGGPPFAIWFPQGEDTQGQYRYIAYRRRTPAGRNIWYFKDTTTKQTIH